MGDDSPYYETWEELFSEIAFSYERQYPPIMDKGFDEDGYETPYITFNKLTIMSNGTMEYKGQYSRFDTALWPKVLLLYKLFEKNGVIDILYGPR